MFLDGEKWKISDITGYNLHFHNCLEIGMCHSDSGTMIIEGQPFSFKAGDVTCIPRHIPHTTYSTPGKASQWTYLFVDLGSLFNAFFHTYSEDFVLSGTNVDNFPYLMCQNQFPKIYALTTCLIDEMRKKKDKYQNAVKGLLMAYYYEIIRQLDTSSASAVNSRRELLSISPALEYIYQNYAAQFTIEHLAELCHLSVAHFRKSFIQIMGDNPLNFLNTIRIERACTLLQTTERSTLTIAEQVGFNTYSSFHRYFTRVIGISPKEYRNSSVWSEIKPNKKSILEYYGWL